MTNHCPLFHYTPLDISTELIKDINFNNDDLVLEPCRGGGAFYDLIPENVSKDWCEIDHGRDLFTYFDSDIYNNQFSKVITNPPYRTNHADVKLRKNICMPFIFRCLELCSDECWFLINLKMWNGLTPLRLKKISEMGFSLCFIRILNIKQWYGRYYWICFKKNATSIIIF